MHLYYSDPLDFVFCNFFISEKIPNTQQHFLKGLDRICASLKFGCKLVILYQISNDKGVGKNARICNYERFVLYFTLIPNGVNYNLSEVLQDEILLSPVNQNYMFPHLTNNILLYTNKFSF